jgi:hypothetical protein
VSQPTTAKLLREMEAEFSANGDRQLSPDERHNARWVFAWLLSRYDLTPKESEATHG